LRSGKVCSESLGDLLPCFQLDPKELAGWVDFKKNVLAIWSQPQIDSAIFQP